MIHSKCMKTNKSLSKYVSARALKSSSFIRSRTNLTEKIKYSNLTNISTYDISTNSLIKLPKLQEKNQGHKRFKIIRKKSQVLANKKKKTDNDFVADVGLDYLRDQNRWIKDIKLKIDPSLKTVKQLCVARVRSSAQVSKIVKLSPLGQERGWSVSNSLNELVYFSPHACFPPSKHTKLKPVSINPSTGVSIFTIN